MVQRLYSVAPRHIVIHRLRFLSSGCHQANEPAAAAQERADHQRDPGDEGKQKLQHSELPGQVSPISQLNDTSEIKTDIRTYLFARM